MKTKNLPPTEALKIFEAKPNEKHINFDKKYDLSNDVIAELSKVYGNSHVWSARSILLMAKNFKSLKDYFQSAYLLETLIESFEQYPQIINEAKKNLIDVKEKASLKNSSVQSNIIANE